MRKKDNGYSGGLAVLHKRLVDAEETDIADKLISRLKGIDTSHSDAAESRFTNLITECFLSQDR